MNLGLQGGDTIPRSLKKSLTDHNFLLLILARSGIKPGKPASKARALTTRLSALSVMDGSSVAVQHWPNIRL